MEYLTPRQKEVLRLAAQGMTQEAVALRLGIKKATVRNHLQAVYDKFGLRGQYRCLVVAVLVAMITRQMCLEEISLELLCQIRKSP